MGWPYPKLWLDTDWEPGSVRLGARPPDLREECASVRNSRYAPIPLPQIDQGKFLWLDHAEQDVYGGTCCYHRLFRAVAGESGSYFSLYWLLETDCTLQRRYYSWGAVSQRAHAYRWLRSPASVQELGTLLWNKYIWSLLTYWEGQCIQLDALQASSGRNLPQAPIKGSGVLFWLCPQGKHFDNYYISSCVYILKPHFNTYTIYILNTPNPLGKLKLPLNNEKADSSLVTSRRLVRIAQLADNVPHLRKFEFSRQQAHSQITNNI